MGRDIYRKRNRPTTEFGLPPAAGVREWGDIQTAIQAIHDNLNNLSNRIIALEARVAAIPEETETRSVTRTQQVASSASISVVGTDVDIENVSGSGYHKHRGFYVAGALVDLPTPSTVENPMFGVVDDGSTCTYYRWDTVEEEWVEIGGGDFELVTADIKANLPASDAPAIGYATTTYRYYVRSNSAWICVSHLEAS